MRINEERMRLEVHAQARSSPVKAVVTVAFILIAVGGGLGYKMYTQHQAEQAAAQAQLDEARAEAKRAQAEFESKMAAIQKDMNDKLASAKSEEERARIRAEAASARAQAQSQQATHSRPSHTGSKSDTTATTKIKNPGKRDVSNDPLEGL
jgi:predicted negative regulator of RcsB-dependent stress response